MNLTKFGNYILSQRTNSGMSRIELAKKIGVSEKTIGLWEKGICIPSLEQVAHLANAFGMSITVLLTQGGLMNNIDDSIREIVSNEKKYEKRYYHLCIGTVSAIALVLSIFLAEEISWLLFGFLMLPIVTLIVFIASVAAFFMFRKTSQRSHKPLIIAGACVLILICLVGLSLLGFILGAPAPT